MGFLSGLEGQREERVTESSHCLLAALKGASKKTSESRYISLSRRYSLPRDRIHTKQISQRKLYIYLISI